MTSPREATPLPGPVLLERARHLDALAALLRGVASGSGHTALVSGEAGIGKTALVRNFTAHYWKVARVLAGQCEVPFTPSPLGPLRDIAQQTGPPLLDALEGGASRSVIFSAVLNELQRGPRPTIAVLEDIHWADEATLAAFTGLIVWTRVVPQETPTSQKHHTIATVFQGTRTITGQTIEFPRYRNQFTALLHVIPPGAYTERHKHLVPSFVYVLAGTLTLTVDDDRARTFRIGEGFAAALNTWHNAENRGSVPLKLLIVHAGEDQQRVHAWPGDDTDQDEMIFCGVPGGSAGCPSVSGSRGRVEGRVVEVVTCRPGPSRARGPGPEEVH